MLSVDYLFGSGGGGGVGEGVKSLNISIYLLQISNNHFKNSKIQKITVLGQGQNFFEIFGLGSIVSEILPPPPPHIEHVLRI